MILFLHGAGERGTDVWKVATHGPPKNVSHAPGFPVYRRLARSARNTRFGRGMCCWRCWTISRRAYAVDTNRIYLTGLSMGGYGTWDLG